MNSTQWLQEIEEALVSVEFTSGLQSYLVKDEATSVGVAALAPGASEGLIVFGREGTVVGFVPIFAADDMLHAELSCLNAPLLGSNDRKWVIAHLISISVTLSTSVVLHTPNQTVREQVFEFASELAVRFSSVTMCGDEITIEDLIIIEEKTVCEYRYYVDENLFIYHFLISIFIANLLQEAIDNVDFIIGTGSVCRKIADFESDIDMFLFTENLSMSFVLEDGEHEFRGYSIDIKQIHEYEEHFESWNIVRKWAFSEGVPILVKDVRRYEAFVKRLSAKSEEIFDHVQCVLLHLGWIGFQPRSWTGKKIRGYHWPTGSDTWVRRGDNHANWKVLDRAFDLLVSLIFLTNGRRYPGAKWKYFLVDRLPFKPPGFSELKRCIVSDRHASDHQRVSESLLDCVDCVVSELEKKRAVADDIYRHSQNCFKSGRGYLDHYR